MELKNSQAENLWILFNENNLVNEYLNGGAVCNAVARSLHYRLLEFIHREPRGRHVYDSLLCLKILNFTNFFPCCKRQFDISYYLIEVYLNKSNMCLIVE